MTTKFLDGEERLVFWLADQSWMTRLDPLEFTEAELDEIHRISEAFWKTQNDLMTRFQFHKRGYV